MTTYVPKAQLERLLAFQNILGLKSAEADGEGTAEITMIPQEIVSVTLRDDTGTFTLMQDSSGGITEIEAYSANAPVPAEAPAPYADPVPAPAPVVPADPNPIVVPTPVIPAPVGPVTTLAPVPPALPTAVPPVV